MKSGMSYGKNVRIIPKNLTIINSLSFIIQILDISAIYILYDNKITQKTKFIGTNITFHEVIAHK